MYKNKGYELSDELYFKIIDDLEITDECVELDPDNLGGTRNTEKGKQLYWLINDTIENYCDD